MAISFTSANLAPRCASPFGSWRVVCAPVDAQRLRWSQLDQFGFDAAISEAVGCLLIDDCVSRISQPAQ